MKFLNRLSLRAKIVIMVNTIVLMFGVMVLFLFGYFKKDYVGQITIQIHTKAGKVLREVYIPIIFPIDPPNAWDLEFANEAHYELSMKFAAENQTDLIIGVSPTGGG